MSGTKDWRTIRGQRPLNEEQVAAYRALMDAEMGLAELRAARGVSQSALARSLQVSQPNVSRIEQEQDVRLSTLLRYVDALGGRLEIRAVFGEETVTLLR